MLWPICQNALKKRGFIFDVEANRNRIGQLEKTMSEAGFWDDPQQAQKVTKKLSQLKDNVSLWEITNCQQEEVQILFELALEEEDSEVIAEVVQGLKDLENQVEQMELKALLSGEYDNSNVILTIHPGAGGTEAQDWAEMLLRMYTRWAEGKEYSIEILDFLPGDEAGIKSVTLYISGPYAYGYLRAEKGVHRLVRISPFDSSGRRHTSFASVEILPEVEESRQIEIDPSDLRIDTYRSSGAGGQHVNKTSSAVRITHLPTGIVVQCQTERSQHQNKESAMKILQSKLLQKQIESERARIEELRGEQRDIAWGSQIRSYVFCPYTMVKDHRTNVEVGNIQAVMDGEIDIFITTYLKQFSPKQ
jgi:peptide chain release factor 2